MGSECRRRHRGDDCARTTGARLQRVASPVAYPQRRDDPLGGPTAADLPRPDLAVGHQPDLRLPLRAPAPLLPKARPSLGHGCSTGVDGAIDAYRRRPRGHDPTRREARPPGRVPSPRHPAHPDRAAESDHHSHRGRCRHRKRKDQRVLPPGVQLSGRHHGLFRMDPRASRLSPDRTAQGSTGHGIRACLPTRRSVEAVALDGR